MSWSVNATGRPEKVAEYLETYGKNMSGQCKAEYEEAKPYLIGLVKQNFVKPGGGRQAIIVQLDASGSGSTIGGDEVSRSCSVTLKQQWMMLD